MAFEGLCQNLKDIKNFKTKTFLAQKWCKTIESSAYYLMKIQTFSKAIPWIAI